MRPLVSFARRLCSQRNFLCKLEPDTYPLDASLRNKPKCSSPAEYEILPGVSPKVFRETEHEQQLGPIHVTGNPAKGFPYKNPEYFSYHSYSYYDIGRAIGCAHRPQPSALSKRDKAFRVPWKEDDDDQRPAEDPTIVMSCRECEDDTPMDRPVVEVAKP
uniref:NADH-ubiquinone oxidoreductase 9 kDa subunit n=1 Tax=Anopheles albimanus TaxID=7167 RepID=A0A8W7K9R4_ANOAL